MTQIKLRRDTSAAFASSNPILGNGEPAYETDTKKLKIGDGTTAYTQLEYFSAGGGGSTNISATLPLKIVDGVISLEVDGQTIQIVDGKLHANLDELGNKVNSLTGEVTDLSGRVTSVETDITNKASKSDLAAKQDKLNPVAPLGINQTTISNITDGTFLTDTSVALNSEFRINYTTDSNARFLIMSPGVSGGATPKSFIQIPFALGDLISFPFEKDGNSSIGLVFGYWRDGLFYPTMLYKTSTTYGSGSSGYAMFAFVSEAGKSSLDKIATYYGLSSAVSKSALEYHTSMPLNATNYIQVTKNAGVPTVNMLFTTDGATRPNSGYTQRMSTSDTTVLENFNKTNVCLFLSGNKSEAINLTKVTRREVGDTVLNPTVDALTTALSTYSNSFDATAKVVTNDLSLAIGSGLAITDGKLTASSTAPTNMVTTDTEQTISGNKELTGITTISNDIKFTIGKKITTPDGQWLMQLGAGFIGIGTSMKPLQTYDGSNYYLHNKSIIAGNGIKITEPNSSEIEISSTSTAYVTEEFVDGTEGYRVWSNGRCEQWGTIRRNGGQTGAYKYTVTLLKTYKDASYQVYATPIVETTGQDAIGILHNGRTTTQITFGSKSDYSNGILWKAEGYIA